MFAGADRTAVDPLSDELHSGLRTRLNLAFAVATCLAALTLAGNPATEKLPVIACFFAFVGFVFVDYLRLFALPPTLAYICLGAIALYSIIRFVDQGLVIADDLQMVLVAELLVMVQAVLMLQRKQRRIYEQLAIFCLLELVVAAIFNDALSYGLLLLPLGFVGAAALAMLQADEATGQSFGERIGRTGGRATEGWSADRATVEAMIRVWAAGSPESFWRSGLVLPLVTTVAVAPAVLLVALAVFYGLPRTNAPSQTGSGGPVLVGFTSNVRLGQIGRMLQSSTPALKVELVDRNDGRVVDDIDRLYLRGAVLERYHTSAEMVGAWSAVPMGNRPSSFTDESPAGPIRATGRPTRDLLARISVEPTNTAALFTLAPYERLIANETLRHHQERWLVYRPDDGVLTKSSRIDYELVTAAFEGVQQTRFVPSGLLRRDWRLASELGDDVVFGPLRDNVVPWSGPVHLARYAEHCLKFDPQRFTTVSRLSDAALRDEELNPLETATRLEQYLISGAGLQYTLDLDGRGDPGIDPIEQFLAVDQRGNCQYFASALALMLRAQGIPSRIVVGYHTDEFNSLGGFYVARQLHAHVWVEALISARWLPAVWDAESDASELASQGYWVRFDPTPGGGGTGQPASGRFVEILDFAQRLWTSYIIQRNASAAARDSQTSEVSSEITSHYRRFFSRIAGSLASFRAGQYGSELWAILRGFSWTTAALAMLFALALLFAPELRRIVRLPWWRDRLPLDPVVAEPRERFYAETLRLLQRLGCHRRIGQTPRELVERAAAILATAGIPSAEQPLHLLTEAFYDRRFGGAAQADPAGGAALPPALADALQQVRLAVARFERHPESSVLKTPSE